MGNDTRPILVVTRKNDSTTDYVLGRMTARSLPFIRLNVEDFGEAAIALRFPDVQNSTLSIQGTDVSIAAIRGVWLRRIARPVVRSMQDGDAKEFAESELDFTLRWLIDLLSNYCPVIDREPRILEGRNKFSQLAVAERFGFSVPRTIVTNDPAAAREFVGQCRAAVIKSVGGYGKQMEDGFYTVYTNLVTEEIIGRLESLRLAPACLQECVAKAFELRITVVGERVFACRIDSQDTESTKIDWRHYDENTPHSIYDVDERMKERIIAFMRNFGIRFASFDFVVTPAGDIVFLEMNPASQFLWIERLTGMPIADALVDEVLAACN